MNAARSNQPDWITSTGEQGSGPALGRAMMLKHRAYPFDLREYKLRLYGLRLRPTVYLECLDAGIAP